jgi:uncharacterized protein YjaG (DUF416 family)
METKHMLKKLLEDMAARDQERINIVNRINRGVPSIDDHLMMAHERATDAINALDVVCHYIMDKERANEQPNAGEGE